MFFLILRCSLPLYLVFACFPCHAGPALWLVQATQGTGQAYLFGSVHFGAESMYPLPAYVTEAFASSNSLVVEIDTLAVRSSEVSKTLRQYGRYPNGTRLNHVLMPEDEERLAELARDLNLSLDRLLCLKPWLAAMQLTTAQIIRLGYRSELGLDFHFLQEARRRKPAMNVVALESLRFQMEMFSHLDEDLQLAFLQQTLDEVESGQSVLTQSLQAWSEGNLPVLERLLLKSLADADQSLRQNVYNLRNRAMAEKLAERLEQGELLFVVVGVGHLLGDESINALLSSRGYRVSRIDSTQRTTGNGG